MISITAEEKRLIREKFPDVHIARTMKQDSRRHHYYMTEDRGPMRLLRKLRDHRQTDVHKDGGDNRRKKTRQ